MGTDDAELFSLFSTHLSVHSSKDFFVSCFHTLRVKAGNIRDFCRGVFQNPGRDCRGGFTKHVREHIIQFEIGDRQAVLRPVFLAGSEVGEFPAVTYQIPKLANICRRDEASGDEVVFEDVSDPLGVSLIRFLSPDGFHILGVSKDDVAGGLQNIVNGDPILSRGLHAHIFAVVFSQPSCAPPQISGECGEALALVGRHAVLIGRSDAGNDEGFVDIHPAAVTVNNFKHNTSPRNSI